MSHRTACPDPLAAAQQAIEAAATAAWRRSGRARTMRARLQASMWLAGAMQPHLAADVGFGVELARLAGLQAVQAALVDDDMVALQAELEATLQALSEA